LESSNSGERSADKTRLLTPAGLMTVAVRAAGAPAPVAAMTAGVAVTPSTVPRRAGVSDTNRGRREVVAVAAGDDSRAVAVVAGNGGAPAAAAAAVEATLTMAAVLGTCDLKSPEMDSGDEGGVSDWMD